MDNNIIQFVGGPCGQHGPYTFYKAFKYKKNGISRIVTLSEFFFVKLWMDSDLLCIGELQLLWIDKNSEQVLASLRLYFLPENTPEGRMDHGEDEVLAIAEKVVLRVEDLVTWITVDAEWTWGRLGKYSKQVKEPPDGDRIEDDVNPVQLTESSLDFSDVEKEKAVLEQEEDKLGPSVMILSYPRYCRYRAMMRRLEGVENEYLKYKIVKALGGFSFAVENTRVMFCRDTFEYPELEGHEMLCNHLAPKLKGRPRGKRKKRSISPGSESNESESSVSTSINAKTKISSDTISNKNGLCIEGSLPRRSTRSSDNSETKEFMKKLTSFMKMKRIPLGRTPSLGFKEIDLHEFYAKVQKLGGYDTVTSSKLWKAIFDEISGHQNSTGAATIIRRHYERLLLPYERHIRGEEYKPLPVAERRRLKNKSDSKSESDTSEGACTSSGTSTSNSLATSTDSPSPTSTATVGDSKESSTNVKQEGKISSLRSVRVKPERQKEKFAKVVKMEDITSSTETLEIVKSEIKTEDITSVVVKQEKPVVQQEAPAVKMENVNTKNEPLTSAVAPVVQKSGSPEKVLVECKESIPIIKTGDTASTNDEELVIVNVPCNPKSLEKLDQNISEEIKSELSEVGNSSANTPFVEELKRGKLDILKEGGLEVTPVRLFSAPSIVKDIRPSVIQSMSNTQITSKLIGSDVQQMPPPLQTSPVKHLPINIPQSLNISKVMVTPTTKPSKLPFFPAKTPSTPPKVVQSRSIYSYSEKTVYGNPKDCLVNSYPVHTPKAPVNLKKHSGGDLLDLTVSSPQKPIVEMRIPNVPTSSNHFSSGVSRNFSKATNLPIFEGRKLGSNLEITLVDSCGKSMTPLQQNSRYSFPQPQHMRSSQNHGYKSHNKRSSSESTNSSKIARLEENGKYNKPSTSSNYHRDREINEVNIPHPFNFKAPNSKAETNVSQAKSFQEAIPSTKNFPAGLAFPITSPSYTKSLYPQSGMASSAPFLQFASQEQLKLYSELMAQNSRIPFPFQLPLQDGRQNHCANDLRTYPWKNCSDNVFLNFGTSSESVHVHSCDFSDHSAQQVTVDVLERTVTREVHKVWVPWGFKGAMMTESEDEVEQTIITLDEGTSYTIILNRRLSLAVAIVIRAVLPTVFNVYYSFLRNQQVLVDNLCNELLPSILAFVANTVSNSLSSVQLGITYPALRKADGDQNQLAIVDDGSPEKSVDLTILSNPKGKIEADVIFIHGLHGGMGRTWTQGQWRHDNHKLKDQSPTVEPTGVMHVPPRRTSLKRTISEIYTTRISKKTMRSQSASCVQTFGEWDIVEFADEEQNEYFTDCWPRDWIHLDCPGVRVLALSYDTDVLWCPIWMKKRIRTGMTQRSQEMIEELLKVGVGRQPIIWVGHSKGGLYIKQIIMNTVEKHDNKDDIINIQRQTKAIMFYSVPHKGSMLADVTLPFLRRSIELLEIQRNCDFIIDLDRRFLDLCNGDNFSPEIFSFIETSFTLMSFLFLKIVPYDSADIAIGTKCGVPLDHREICKPAGRDCFLYLELIKLIKKVINNNSES
ncbi:hypothetical protein HHI36_016200 [Cryptolaemus montrouzieri]|uniref:ARID domain-containing protein n=1 Tax=Cryptolaemus montrouzieri TaxID=559131 RepID=A0ABD2NJ79_9CUCU